MSEERIALACIAALLCLVWAVSGWEQAIINLGFVGLGMFVGAL